MPLDFEGRAGIGPATGGEFALRAVSAASQSEAAISPGAIVMLYGQNLTDRTETVLRGAFRFR